MNITIVKVDVVTVPTQKGSYQKAEAIYKNNSFGGKVESKAVMSFGAGQESFKVLASATPGDTFEVNVVKNDKGYNDWVSMQKSAGNSSVSPQQGQVSFAGGAGSTQGPRTSTYETPEERAKKQVYIVRQSSASVAQSALSVGAKSPPKVEDVIDYAKKLEAYVFDTKVVAHNEISMDEFPVEPE